jgi:extradiol dioxygenase family protein
MSVNVSQFHLAFPVRDLEEAKLFYTDVIGCSVGRVTWNHIDFNMYGHHVVAHLVPNIGTAAMGEFDGHEVPVPHFGLNLTMAEWQGLAERLTKCNAKFREHPHIRLKGKVGEHSTLFVYDPSGNALEFKTFHDPEQAFAIDPAELEAEAQAHGHAKEH